MVSKIPLLCISGLVNILKRSLLGHLNALARALAPNKKFGLHYYYYVPHLNKYHLPRKKIKVN